LRQLQPGVGYKALLSPLVLSILIFTGTVTLLVGGGAQAQECGPCALAGRIEQEELVSTVRELSGADSVMVGGVMQRILTRSALLPEKLIARDYLLERIAELGYSAYRQVHPLSVYYPDLFAMESSAAGDTIWIGSTEGEVMMMTAAGGWDDMRVISRIEARIFDLALDSLGTLWAACKKKEVGFGQLLYSKDGGSSWQVKVDGDRINNVLSLNSIVFSSSDAAMICGAGGTAMRMQRVIDEWYVTYLDHSQFYYRHLYGSATSGPMHVWFVSVGGTIFESSDLGGSWTDTTLEYSNLRDIEFQGPDRGIAVGDGLVCYTSDGGRSWGKTNLGANLFSVSMLDTLRAVAAGTSGDVWATTDGGGSWTRVTYDCSREDDIMATVARPPDTVWAVGRNKPLRLELGDQDVSCRQWEMADTIWGENLIFGSEGRSFPDEKIILCAHYDSKNWRDPYEAPGADDNASGCAGVLEIARAFAGAAFERSIEYILFDGEEIGLIGSRYYVAERDTDLTISAVLNLDMIGRDYGGGITLQIAGREDPIDSSLATLIADMVSLLQLNLECSYDYLDSPTSDHMPFWEIDGVPSVLLIENEYRNNPHYHEHSDAAEYIDFVYMTDVVKAAAGSAAELAGLISTDPLPPSIVLHQNFPNPLFNHTRIRFELPDRLYVDLSLFDLSGRKVITMIGDTLDEGRHEYAWDGKGTSGTDVASGVYFLRLSAGGTESVRKVVIVR
jgi:hypothetical protein